jgi:phosphatidylserine decarboxylase
MITKYGIDVAVPILIGAALMVILGIFISNLPLKIVFILLGLGILVFTLNFFRDPDRTTPDVKGGVISPADGKVVRIDEVEENEYFNGKAKIVCVFMSPLNVHVNRFPVTGEVDFFRYIPGEFLVAFDDKSSERNERTMIGINTGDFRVMFKQIAGFVARRIVCPVEVGDSAQVGERFGMIRFGSRVDVFVPIDAEIQVQLDQIVTAGETVLAVVKR